MSFPLRKTVSLEESAWTAKMEEDVAIDESITVSTFGNVALVNARGDTNDRDRLGMRDYNIV